MLFTILGWILFGLIAGFIARAIVPGKDDWLRQPAPSPSASQPAPQPSTGEELPDEQLPTETPAP